MNKTLIWIFICSTKSNSMISIIPYRHTQTQKCVSKCQITQCDREKYYHSQELTYFSNSYNLLDFTLKTITTTTTTRKKYFVLFYYFHLISFVFLLTAARGLWIVVATKEKEGALIQDNKNHSLIHSFIRFSKIKRKTETIKT